MLRSRWREYWPGTLDWSLILKKSIKSVRWSPMASYSPKFNTSQCPCQWGGSSTHHQMEGPRGSLRAGSKERKEGWAETQCELAYGLWEEHSGQLLIQIWQVHWKGWEGPVKKKLEKKGDLIYEYGVERFGSCASRKKSALWEVKSRWWKEIDGLIM